MRTIKLLRPITGPDRDAVLALIAQVRKAHGTEPLSEHKLLAIGRGGSESTGIVVRDEAAVLAYAHLEAQGDGYVCEIVTSTEVGGSDRDLMTIELLERIVAEVGSLGGGRLDYFVPSPSESDETLSARLGFAPTRELLILRRRNSPDDLSSIDGPDVTPFRVGADEDAWLELNARAFAWHPEQGSWTRADLDAREAEPWFDPAGFLCCWIDGKLAGACWTKIDRDVDAVGEIYVMSVDPDFQGRGIGRVILRHALAYLTAAGLAATILYVEGDNDSALGLYRAFGFENASRTVVETREVAAV